MRRGRRDAVGADGIPAVAAPGWACNVACMAPTTTATLAALVGFDSASRNPGLFLIGCARARLDAPVMPCRISPDATGLETNLHPTIGPHALGSVALSSHVDALPAYGQVEGTDPFSLAACDGRLQACGDAEMHRGVAAMLAPAVLTSVGSSCGGLIRRPAARLAA